MSDPGSDTYKVAALLYTAVSDDAGKTASATIRKNFDLLSGFASQAAEQGAQLIVFPESTTGTLEWPDFNNTKAAEYAEVYPAVGSDICGEDGMSTFNSDSYYQHYTTACMAKNNSLYVVMNIPETLDCSESDADRDRKMQDTGAASSPEEVSCADLAEKRLYLFNSLAIYDPTGTLLAKYRKTSTFPLYYDTAFPEQDKEKADFTTFVTSFGVEFGVLICADATNPLLFPVYAKAGIKNILLPLYDGGRPPASSITAVHAGHSYNYGINVIASQSQTFSGVGLWESGSIPKYWSLNPDPFSGQPYYELIVVDVVKDPSPPDPLTETATLGAATDMAPETCRWLGNEDSEVECPCYKIELNSDAPTNFVGTLNQTVVMPNQESAELECTIQATMSTQENSTQTYAMMVGWRNSSQLDYILFCEIVVCHDFPDCSKDCPLCLAPYIGAGTLTSFALEASVPDYFENSDRQMRIPIMNTFGGMPMSGENYAWKAESGKRYMALNNESTVPTLMGAGIFYVGFAPLVETDMPPPTLPGNGTSGQAPCMATNQHALWLVVCLIVYMLR